MSPHMKVADRLDLAEDQKPLTKREIEWASKLAEMLAHKPERLELVSFASGLAVLDGQQIGREDFDLSFCGDEYILARFDAQVRGTVD